MLRVVKTHANLRARTGRFGWSRSRRLALALFLASLVEQPHLFLEFDRILLQLLESVPAFRGLAFLGNVQVSTIALNHEEKSRRRLLVVGVERDLTLTRLDTPVDFGQSGFACLFQLVVFADKGKQRRIAREDVDTALEINVRHRHFEYGLIGEATRVIVTILQIQTLRIL